VARASISNANQDSAGYTAASENRETIDGQDYLHMSKKQRRRAQHSKSAPSKLSPETAARKARSDLDSGRHREAIAGFKQLLKLEPCAEWRAALADAYTGRARELTAKGMLKEALVIWENRTRLGEGVSFELDQAALLLRMGRVESVLALFADTDAVPTIERNRLRSLLAARLLAGEEIIISRLPADDPVVLHAETAKAALAAYCAGDDAALRTALAAIPFRSPYRDWVQILKALQRLHESPEEAAGLLDRVSESSAFGPLRRAAQLALLPEANFRETILDADKSAARFAYLLRGWSEERVSLWQELNRLGTSHRSEKLLRLMYRHRNVLGEDWIRRRGLRLLIGNYPASLDWPASMGEHTTRTEEAILITAWNAERRENLWDQQEYWERYAHYLIQEPNDDGSDLERNMRIALALRRCERTNDFLSHATPSDDPEDLGRVLAKNLEESLRWDPDDRETYLRLIRYYRLAKHLKDVRRLLEQARCRWPQDMQIFDAALNAALDGGSFKKAAGLAREMLALDPINSGVRERLVGAHLSHARKQIAKGRSDLARKEIAIAREWARSAAARDELDLTEGLIALIEDAETGSPVLRGMVGRFGDGLAGQLTFAIAGEALGLSPKKLFQHIEIDKPTTAGRDDLLATFTRLRTHLDGGGKIAGELAAYVSKALGSAPWTDLSREETEAACETLRRCDLDNVRLRLARVALRRWKGEPILELHAFEAKNTKGLNASSHKDISRLEAALDRANQKGDTRTAVRIERTLASLNPFAIDPLSPLPPMSPMPPPNSKDFSLESDVEMLAALIEMLGLDKALDRIGVPPEAKRELKKLDRRSGNRAVAEALVAVSELLFEPIDGKEPTPVPQPPPRGSPRPKGKKSKRRVVDDPDGDDGPFPDQLDLF
jgi:tetratricopeptide (TPR) repeat protein